MRPTDLARAFAIVMIANSHLESLYPIPQLAADGLLGDVLFFVLSGFGLALSEKSAPRAFPSWYARRVSRIYPAVWLVALGMTLFAVPTQAAGSTNLLARFLWPTPFPFIGQILVFYLGFFALLKWQARAGGPRLFVWVAAALCPVYLLLWSTRLSEPRGIHELHWVYYFQMMLLGAWWAGSATSSPARTAAETHKALFGCMGCLALYFVVKAAVVLSRRSDLVILTHALMVPVAWSILRLAHAAPVVPFVLRFPAVSVAVRFLARRTLEIYLIHELVANSGVVQACPFPLNLALFWALTVPAAAILGRLADWNQLVKCWRARQAASPRSEATDQVVSPVLALSVRETME